MKYAIQQAPFDVLGEAEMLFDLSPRGLELQDLLIGERLPILPLRLNLQSFGAAILTSNYSQLLGGYLLRENLAVTHLINISIHQARDQGLAKAEAGVNGRDLPVGSDGIGSKQNSRRLREDHLLHHHSEVNFAVIKAASNAIGDRCLGVQRCPALANVLQDCLFPQDVQIRILLASEGGRREILSGCAGPYGIGPLVPKPGEMAAHLLINVFGNGYLFDEPANHNAELR